MSLLKPKRVKLAQTQEAFDAQAEEFLTSNGFELNPDNLALFGSFIQHSSEHEDSFVPSLMAKRIRKAHANAFAFYLIKPERRPAKEAPDAPKADTQE